MATGIGGQPSDAASARVNAYAMAIPGTTLVLTAADSLAPGCSRAKVAVAATPTDTRASWPALQFRRSIPPVGSFAISSPSAQHAAHAMGATRYRSDASGFRAE